jgi:serine beta-lactamase-like protein LACTB, mitochondrial
MRALPSLPTRIGLGVQRLRALALATVLASVPLLPAGADAAQDVARAGAALPSWQSEIESARSAARELVDSENLPGLSIAVGIGGDVVWSEGFGWADLENRVPVTPLHKFRVGSVSKPMAAAAMGILMEEGALDLDAPVQSYVPEFPEKRWPVTSRQVAGHVAGIRHYRGAEFLSAQRYGDVRESLEVFAADSLLFEPGTDYSYSTYGWNLLSAVVQGAADTAFLEFMRTRVFEPLAMVHTVAAHTDSIIDYRVRFYDQNEDGSLRNSPWVDNSNKWAGGGFLSTPEDLIRFGFGHLDGSILEPATVAELFAPMELESGESTNYGVGWRDYSEEGGPYVVGHTGGSVGGTTAFLVFPDHQVVVAVVVNLSNAPGLVQLAREIGEAFAARGSGT